MIKKQFFMFSCAFTLMLINTEAGTETVETLNKGVSEVTTTITSDIGSKINPLKLNYRGKLYGERGVSLMHEGKEAPEESDQFIEYLRSMYDTVRNNRQEDYIKLWHSGDRGEIENSYKQDPNSWERYCGSVRGREDYRLMSIIKYGDYVMAQVLCIYDSKSVKVNTKLITLIKEDGEYRLTNDLIKSRDMLWGYFDQDDGFRYDEAYKRRKTAEQ